MGVATVFDVEVPAETLALAETFERAPDVQIRMERLVGAGTDQPLPFAWVSGVETGRVPDLLAADSTVDEAEKLGEDGDTQLFEIGFSGDIQGFTDTIFEHDGVVLRASATDGVWNFQLRFADHADVGEVFDDEFTREYDATVTRLYASSDSPSTQMGLTQKQQAALAAAFDMGYYDIPRSVDLQAVSDRLHISRQAVSERLRRGHGILVADLLGETDDPD